MICDRSVLFENASVIIESAIESVDEKLVIDYLYSIW